MIRFENPLLWLKQQPRTIRPNRSQFGSHTVHKSANFLTGELERLGAKNCLISSNLKIRLDGNGFYSNQKVDDVGIVVYFDLKGKGKAMACDKWDRIEHNLWALYLSVSAIRGLERWGGSELLEGLFTGFKALPSPEDVTSKEINYFQEVNNFEELRICYKKLAMKLHPDTGGDANEFQNMQRQYDQRKNNFPRSHQEGETGLGSK